MSIQLKLGHRRQNQMGNDESGLTKNSEGLLRQSLASVYKNVPVDNLIIVDDDSTDRTVEIVKEFQRKYGNVILVA